MFCYFPLLISWKLGDQCLLEGLETSCWAEREHFPSACFQAVLSMVSHKHTPHLINTFFQILLTYCPLICHFWLFVSFLLPLSCAWETECALPPHISQSSTVPLAHVQPTIYCVEPSREPLLTEYQASYSAGVRRQQRSAVCEMFLHSISVLYYLSVSS